MSGEPSNIYEAIGVAGKVVGPCGIVIPVVLSEDGTVAKPLGADTPTVSTDEIHELASSGFLTLFAGAPDKTVEVSAGYRVAWASNELLQVSTETDKIWRDLIKQSRTSNTSVTRFERDGSRDVLVAPGRDIFEAFERIERSVVSAYRSGYINGMDREGLLREFELGLRATLYTSRARPRRRLDTLRHLGHLYLINGFQQKLETLFRLELERPPSECSFEQYFKELESLGNTLQYARDDARRGHTVEHSII